jgi:hypothetical protein
LSFARPKKTIRNQHSGAVMQDQYAVLDIEELDSVGGGWGQVDPST